jgi:hypothetical protein
VKYYTGAAPAAATSTDRLVAVVRCTVAPCTYTLVGGFGGARATGTLAAVGQVDRFADWQDDGLVLVPTSGEASLEVWTWTASGCC